MNSTAASSTDARQRDQKRPARHAGRAYARWRAASWRNQGRSQRGWRSVLPGPAAPLQEARTPGRSRRMGVRPRAGAGRRTCPRPEAHERQADSTKLTAARRLPETTSSGFSMPSLHRLGTEAELAARAPFAVKIERHRIAIFQHDGRLHAHLRHLQSPRRSAVRRTPARRVRDVSLARVGVQRDHRQGTGGLRRGAGAGLSPRDAGGRRLRRASAGDAAAPAQAQAVAPARAAPQAGRARRRACSGSPPPAWTR